MPKVKKQRVSEVQSKASKARAFSGQKLKGAGMFGGPEAEWELQEAAMNLSRGKKANTREKIFGRFPTKAESKAALMMQNSRAAELERSAARAASVTKRAKAKAEKAKTLRALTGGAKKAAPKAKKAKKK
jgi:hypothetical protein